MGKKVKKTRWRALSLNGHQSDSEESSTKSSQNYKIHHQPTSYSKYYASRRFQSDSGKSTRSNSTASEHKATFNEDEYTRITTPRQDVLFKKGYLNKPKTYQTQTSTGTSSTANSTSTCTPDHQSADGTEGTDLEYESQFVFPNGFVDQNGIYYIQSIEPFPLIVYNAPICYSEYPSSKAKRYSTDSQTDSVSPQNEEAGQEEYHNGHDDHVGGAPHVFTHFEPPRYVKEASTIPNEHQRRATSEEESSDSSDEVFSQDEPRVNGHREPSERPSSPAKPAPQEEPQLVAPAQDRAEAAPPTPADAAAAPMSSEAVDETCDGDEPLQPADDAQAGANSAQNLLLQGILKTSDGSVEQDCRRSSLKPDAEEFVPRSLPLSFDPRYMPPFIPISFIPPGIPVGFVPDPKMHHYMVPNQDVQEEAEEEEVEEPPKKNNEIDIAKIVSKLEEAAKQQKQEKRRFNPKFSPKFNNQWGRYNRYQDDSRRGRPGDKPYSKFRKFDGRKEEEKEPSPARVERRASQQPPPAPVENVKKTPERAPKPAPQRETPRKNYCESVKTNISPKRDRQEEKEKPKKNQWISVSSRKKRKQKVEYRAEDAEQEVEANDDHLYESFDVNQLEDIIPPSQSDDCPNEGDAVAVVTEAPAEETVEAKEDPPVKEAVEELPKEEPKGGELQSGDWFETQPAANSELESVNQNEDLQDAPTTKSEKDQSRSKSQNKKSKKNQKFTRRVIITDPEVRSSPPPPPSKEAKEEAISLPQETPKCEVDEPAPPEVEEPTKSEASSVQTQSESDAVLDTPEKKSKKKKKKPKKTPSPSSSTNTLNIDDSYDFLLENSLSDIDQKTNVEISQELDRMIQKGMYSSLEEKVRSLKVDALEDGFFKTVNYNFLEPQRNPFLKGTTFGKMLRPLKNDSLSIDFSQLKSESQPSTSKAFRDEEEPEKDQERKGEDISIAQLNLLTATTPNSSCGDHLRPPSANYPITQAVKEWMTRTRENTPDVEILKSPNAIYKELYETEKSREDEEVTVWSVSAHDSCDEELQWDDELKAIGRIEEVAVRVEARNGNGPVEQGEEAVEAYESSYGKNEDYLKIQRDVEEQRRSFPRHGDLPYRAICCSIM